MDRIKSLFRKNPKLMAGLVVLLALSLPFVINQVLKEQDIRQGAQSVPSVSFNFTPATKTNIKVGESFEVKLIMNAGTHDIGGLSYILKFDPHKLQMTEGSADTALKSISKKTEGGNFTITYINPLATTVTGNNLTVQNFTFKALSQGEATVSLNEIKVTGKNIGSFVPVENASGIIGSYTVIGATVNETTDPTATPTTKPEDPTATPTSIPIDVCKADNNRPENCSCTEAIQCLSNTCTNKKCVAPPQNEVPQGTTGLKLSVKIPGIGEKTATIDDNPQPKNSSRIAKVKILNNANTPLTFGQNNSDTIETALLFNTTTYRFEGIVDLGTTIESGNYLVKLSVSNSLYKQIPGIVSITKGKSDNTATGITLVTGDLDQNNSLGVSDWTNMIACNENKPACTADIRALADLNDNGEIDALDVQILQVGFGTREGD